MMVPCFAPTTTTNTILVLLGLLIGLTFLPDAIHADVENIVGPWLDSYNNGPNITLLVCYHDDQCVKQDEILSLRSTFYKPFVTFFGYGMSEDDKYCYMMLDSDEYNPEHPYARNSLHWLVCDIPGWKSHEPNVLKEDVTESGITMVPYTRPRKPFLTHGSKGVHRYYNLLFKQAHAQQIFEEIQERRHFSVRTFSQTYKLGYPVAGLAFKLNYTRDD